MPRSLVPGNACKGCNSCSLVDILRQNCRLCLYLWKSALPISEGVKYNVGTGSHVSFKSLSHKHVAVLILVPPAPQAENCVYCSPVLRLSKCLCRQLACCDLHFKTLFTLLLSPNAFTGLASPKGAASRLGAAWRSAGSSGSRGAAWKGRGASELLLLANCTESHFPPSANPPSPKTLLRRLLFSIVGIQYSPVPKLSGCKL